MMLMGLAAMAAMAADTAASGPRTAFSDCLRTALRQAKNDKMPVESFDGFMRGHCTAEAGALTKAVIAIDVKNGVSRKEAAENARLELDDYYVGMFERYEYEQRDKPPG